MFSPDNIFTTTIDKAVRWSRTQSMWPVTFGLACCAIEMMAAGSAKYDFARYGMEVFRASPRQADLMIVAGRVSQKMAPVLRQVYDQMAEPKWVIAMGACSSTGGMFNNYALVQGVDHIVPVDIYVPGCPPGPQSLMHGILTLHDKIMDGESNVIVTDGFSGNIALKTGEGTATLVRALFKETFNKSLMAKIASLIAFNSLKNLRKRIDPRRVNGGVF